MDSKPFDTLKAYTFVFIHSGGDYTFRTPFFFNSEATFPSNHNPREFMRCFRNGFRPSGEPAAPLLGGGGDHLAHAPPRDPDA